MANNWKKVKINFKTVKLSSFIEPIKKTYSEFNDEKYSLVFGVSNTNGICITGKEASKDISKYIILEEDCFVFNPYRINVGSIGINDKKLKGCVSPAYVVFKTNNKMNPHFLYYYLKSEYGNHLINWYGNRGGVRNALRYNDLCQIDIPNIDLPTQLVLLKNIQNCNGTLENLRHESENQSTLLTKLRQAIIQEAIEGKLTTSWRKENPVRKGDPDYDAEALLEKIKTEKEKLIKEGKIKKEKNLSEINPEEIPFELPKGWVWTRLGEIGIVNPRNCLDDNLEISFSPMNLISEKYGVNPKFEVKTWKEVKKGFTHFAENDIAIAKITPCFENSKAGVFKHLKNKYGAGTTELHILRPIIVLSDYVYVNVKTKKFLNEGSKLMTGAVGQKRVPVDYFSNYLIPLPPLAEQHAIVERVEKLLSMVDELEKQVAERKEQSEQLMQAVLREAFEGKSLAKEKV